MEQQIVVSLSLKKKKSINKGKNFCLAKDDIMRISRQATDGKKIFVKGTSDKGLLSKYTMNP